MGLIKKYKVVIAVVLPVLILVLLRSFGSNHFKSDAKKLAEPSVLRSNIISVDNTGTLPGKKLIINLNEEKNLISGNGVESLIVSADSILNKNILRTIGKHEGPVLLYSADVAVSARLWMLLSQLGYRNLYILADDTDNEISKNKFRPDTLVRPEL
jgi:hypothetical protein